LVRLGWHSDDPRSCRHRIHQHADYLSCHGTTFARRLRFIDSVHCSTPSSICFLLDHCHSRRRTRFMPADSSYPLANHSQHAFPVHQKFVMIRCARKPPERMKRLDLGTGAPLKVISESMSALVALLKRLSDSDNERDCTASESWTRTKFGYDNILRVAVGHCRGPRRREAIILRSRGQPTDQLGKPAAGATTRRTS